MADAHTPRPYEFFAADKLALTGSTELLGPILRRRTGSHMRLLSIIVEIVVVTICMPFYAVVLPIMHWANIRAAKQISMMNCPHCKVLMSTITWRDLEPCGVRLRITSGTKLNWDRMPRYAVVCPACNQRICFDGSFCFTDCNLSDALVRVGQPESSDVFDDDV